MRIAPPSAKEPRLRRVGHKGADLIAPGNTYESFDAALFAGVDMIEFDVLPEREGDRLIQWRWVTETLVDAVATAGGELYVWTVDDLVRLRELEAMGVTGVITNDPRLFAELAA